MAKHGKRIKYHKRYKLVDNSLVSLHPNYVIWGNMKERCYNMDNPNYHHYGGRGILMCESWFNSFESFAQDMGVRPSLQHSIDRRDNDKGYSPDNCRWVTRAEQMRNRRKFETNTTGEVGVIKVENNRYSARYDDNGIRYELGRFVSVRDAAIARARFIYLLVADPEAAETMLQRRARYDSTTGIRGISKHSDGYIVRKTINGKRVYLGFRKTFEEAVELWNANK